MGGADDSERAAHDRQIAYYSSPPPFAVYLLSIGPIRKRLTKSGSVGSSVCCTEARSKAFQSIRGILVPTADDAGE